MSKTLGSQARAFFALGLLAMFVWECRALFVPVAPIRAAGSPESEITAFAAGTPVGQTFRIAADGLNTAIVEFQADRPAELTVSYRLMGWAPAKLEDHWAAVIASTETFPLSKGRSRHAFRFKGIADSGRQVYQFQIQQLEVRSTDGHTGPPAVSVIDSVDNLDDGNVIVGKDQIVDRDLLFEARGADSRFDDFWLKVTPQLPRPLRTPSLQWAIGLALIAIYNWAFAVFAYRTLVSAQEAMWKEPTR